MSITEKIRATLHGKQQDYQLTFGGVQGRRVLKDLARFCRANETCFHADPRVHAVAEGRREVFLRIQQYLNLSPDDLAKLKGVD